MPIDPPVYIGGLLRCCTATLREDCAAREQLPAEGEALACKYCKNPMIFTDGAWRWHRAEALKDSGLLDN